jgi:hypothetical protein
MTLECAAILFKNPHPIADRYGDVILFSIPPAITDPSDPAMVFADHPPIVHGQ